MYADKELCERIMDSVKGCGCAFLKMLIILLSVVKDPQEKLRERCSEKSECAQLLEKMNNCNDRVNSKSKTSETCMEELIDYMHCVDHCVRIIFFMLT